jgi:hypothetical protein
MTRSPRRVLVCEPDQLGVEGAHPQLAFGVRLVELAEPNRACRSHPATELSGRAAGSNDLLYASERLFANLCLACHQASSVLLRPCRYA